MKQKKKSLDFLDYDFFNFLKFIFRNGGVDKKKLMARFGGDKNEFNLFNEMAISKGYIIKVLKGKRKELSYHITPEGVYFLLEFKKIQKEEKHSNVIKWATIILAVSALVQIIDIWVNKPTTKETIIITWGKLVAGTLSIIQSLIPLVILIVIIVIIVKIIKKVKEKKKFTSHNK